MKLENLTISKIKESLEEGKFSAQDLTEKYLEKIKKENKELSAYLSVTKELALEQAKEVDKKLKKGEAGKLAGVPIAIKDNILVKGESCTAASKILEDYIAPYNATCIEKLKKEGAIILGKTNLDEFAMGSSTENSAFQITKNPHDKKRVPGGSSGGSAAATAADLCQASLGSDTGGSIRQPAAFCGTVGLKPTYGAVSRYGLMAFASSLDQIGPITKTVEDARILFSVLTGKDEKDSTSMEIDFDKIKIDIKKTTIGVPKEYFKEGIDKEIKDKVMERIEDYKKMGAKIKEVSLPHTKYALPAYYIISPSEASSNLARYDGVKYGLNTKKGNYKDVRGKGFGDEVKRRIMLGTYCLSSGYYDAYYKKAQKVRTLIKKDFTKAFEEVDFLITPTSPTPAFEIGQKSEDPLSMYLADICTIPVNLAGLPAVSVPAGKTNSLPVGLQIIGKPFEEYKILELANLIYD